MCSHEVVFFHYLLERGQEFKQSAKLHRKHDCRDSWELVLCEETRFVRSSDFYARKKLQGCKDDGAAGCVMGTRKKEIGHRIASKSAV